MGKSRYYRKQIKKNMKYKFESRQFVIKFLNELVMFLRIKKLTEKIIKTERKYIGRMTRADGNNAGITFFDI